jgi:hypothetical protein
MNIANHVKAIEANEMLDVTPCTDAAGKWEGGPNCKDFPAKSAERRRHADATTRRRPVYSPTRVAPTVAWRRRGGRGRWRGNGGERRRRGIGRCRGIGSRGRSEWFRRIEW